MIERCCSEHGCRRKQPILLRPGGLDPERFYVLTRYKRLPGAEGRGGGVRADQKHVLDADSTAVLNRWRAACAVLAELVALKDGPRGEEYELRKPEVWARARAVFEEADRG